MRAWTDQGRLRCLRINERGDRRYRVADLQTFLDEAGLQPPPYQPFASRVRPALGGSREVPSLPVRLTVQSGGVVSLPDTSPVVLHESAARRRSGRRVTPVAGLTRAGTRFDVTRDDGALPTARVLVPLRDSAGGSSPASPTDAAVGVLPAPATISMPAARGQSLLDQIRDQLRDRRGLEEALHAAAASLLETHHFRTVAVAQWHDGRVLPVLVEGVDRGSDWLDHADSNLVAVALREGRPVAVPTASRHDANGSRPPATVTVYAPVGRAEQPWGVLIVETASERPLSRADLDLLDAVSSAVEVMATHAELADMVAEQQRRSDALASITAELSALVDVSVLTRTLVNRALPMFGADRAALFRIVDGHAVVDASANLSQDFAEAVRTIDPSPNNIFGAATGHAVAFRDVLEDPRVGDFAPVIEREGFHSVALAPLLADSEMIGMLGVYHDQRHAWSKPDLDLLQALGTQAGVALRNAKNYQLMATWAAQLQSIQQLGTRLNRWGTVTAIGQAIAAELRQLIDYHNVRVYRVHGNDVEPVAWRGEIGEYTDEERDQLRLTVGEGITGWVAQNGIPQYLPDAARDPRSQTIPGTEDDLAESMLIAPMLYEDQVLGVIVLSKLGVNQFTGDDLRYLEIYASIAAQAMVNADATEQLKEQSDRLARQLSSQRELMQVTESILSTLDPSTVVEEIADRLGGLLRVDNIAIGIHDADAHVVRTLFASGTDSEMFMDVVIKDDEGVAGWVIQHGEALLIPRTQDDERFINFGGRVKPGAVMAAPLRSRDKVTGTLLLERIGESAAFEAEEFELLQLFAGHVSIALQNAQAHQAVEIRAQTDALTGLKNQGTFQEYLQVTVKRGNPFSLLIVDLDDFKSFNDHRGHEAGNVLLATIAKALRAACRDSDEVFRYGGDEFALILPNTDEEGAMEVAAKVGRAVRTAPAPGARRISGVTCSIGVAAFPEDAGDRDAILLAADRACYVAKRNGRNRAVTAADALALAGDVLPDGPTPVDDPGLTADAA